MSTKKSSAKITVLPPAPSMQPVAVTMYRADDGAMFGDIEAARAHNVARIVGSLLPQLHVDVDFRGETSDILTDADKVSMFVLLLREPRLRPFIDSILNEAK